MSPSPRGAAPAGTDFPDGTASVFARTISAEIRARMAAQRITGRKMADLTGMSHSYLAKRLRDALPFTLDDLDRILGVWDEDGPSFMEAAWNNHFERIAFEAEDARAAARPAGDLDRARIDLERARLDHDRAVAAVDFIHHQDFELAAHDEEFTIEAEQEADEHP